MHWLATHKKGKYAHIVISINDEVTEWIDVKELFDGTIQEDTEM